MTDSKVDIENLKGLPAMSEAIERKLEEVRLAIYNRKTGEPLKEVLERELKPLLEICEKYRRVRCIADLDEQYDLLLAPKGGSHDD